MPGKTPAAPERSSMLYRVNDVVRFVLEIAAIAILALWGFLAFPLPWPGVAIGIGAPVFAILIWALFRSPKAVFEVDLFVKALVEIAVFSAAALGLWQLGFPILAAVFAVVAAASGILNGRREINEA